MARKLAVAKLRRVLEPKLESNGLEWDDVLPILEAIDTIDELREAMDNPEAFLEKMLSETVGPVARKVTLARLRRVLEPKLKTFKMPLIPEIAGAPEATASSMSIREAPTLFAAASEPVVAKAPSTERVALRTPGRNAMSRARARTKSINSAVVQSHGAGTRSTVVAAEEIQLVNTVESSLNKAEPTPSPPPSPPSPSAGNIRSQGHAASSSPATEQMLQELEWDDVLPVLELFSFEELQQAWTDLDAFVKKLAAASAAAAKIVVKKAIRNQQKQTQKRFALDVARLPPQFRKLHELFFDTRSSQNAVTILKTVASNFLGVVKNSAKLIYQIANLVRKCFPPFPIVTDVSKDIGMLIMSLDFKLHQLPFKLAKSLRQILLIPRDMLRFAGSVKSLIKVMRAAFSKRTAALTAPQLKLLESKDVADGEDDEIAPAADGTDTDGVLGELGAATGEATAIAMEAEALPDEPPPGMAIAIQDDEGEMVVGEEDEQPEDADDDSDNEDGEAAAPVAQTMARGRNNLA